VVLPSESGANVTLPSDRAIVITRVFDAPRAVVFDAWTQPEHVAQWWDPRRKPLAVCEIDLRPGGSFRFVNQGVDGLQHPFVGVYREIAPPSRLVFTTRVGPSAAECVGTIHFEESEGKTILTLTMECARKEDRDAMLRMRIDVGTVQTLSNLGEYLGTRGEQQT